MEAAYIGLLRADLTEPCKESGYKRVLVECKNILDPFTGQQIVFPDVSMPGYGEIHCVATFDRQFGGEALHIWNLPHVRDVHPDVVPVIYNGDLLMGMEVKAEVILNSADLFKT